MSYFPALDEESKSISLFYSSNYVGVQSFRVIGGGGGDFRRRLWRFGDGGVVEKKEKRGLMWELLTLLFRVRKCR